MPMNAGKKRTFAVFAVLALCLTAMGAVATFTNESEAAKGTFTDGDYNDPGSSSDPWTGVDCNTTQLPSTLYVAVGSTVHIHEYVESMFIGFVSVTSGYGLTISNGSNYDECTLTGTLSRTGTITIAMEFDTGGGNYATEERTIVCVEAPVETTPVTSITISGSSSVDVGSTITLTATTSPSGADDRTVTWSISSGSSRATIQSTSDTSTGGRCVLKGVSAGSVTVMATASDGSGVTKTKTITVSEPEYDYYLYYQDNGGSGGPGTVTKTANDTTSTLSFTIPSTEPTRSGYTFLGWSTSSTATSATYTTGDTVGVTYDDLTLYAVWQQDTQNWYAYLYYNANNGSGAPSTQSAYINAVSASGSKTFTIPSTVPTRSGYDFQGWATTSSATTAQYDAGDSISVAYGSSVTLYAVWKQATITLSGTPDAHGIVGTTWKYTPTVNVSGCTLSVSGASWLTASGTSVSGVPTAAGEYTITVTASKTNYVSGTQTFTVTILSSLSFTSSPTGGAIIYAM